MSDKVEPARPRYKGEPMISAIAVRLIQRAVDEKSEEGEQALISYMAALEDAAPLVPTFAAEREAWKTFPKDTARMLPRED